MAALIAGLQGYKSYIVAGFGVATWLAGALGLIEPATVDRGLTLAAGLFGVTLTAKVNRIRAALAS
jgi:hypothetical protein